MSALSAVPTRRQVHRQGRHVFWYVCTLLVIAGC